MIMKQVSQKKKKNYLVEVIWKMVHLLIIFFISFVCFQGSIQEGTAVSIRNMGLVRSISNSDTANYNISKASLSVIKWTKDDHLTK